MSPPPDIRPLAPGDVDSLAVLFERFPYKVAQRRVQKLDRARLNAFYLAGLRRGFEAGHPHWIALRGGEPVAVAGLQPDAWHSEIYGLRMAKIAPWMSALDPDAGAPLLERVLGRARENGDENLSIRMDGEDFANLHLFESNGFRLNDVSLKFTRPMRDFPDPPPRGFRIREATESDGPWMRELGSRAHAASHFLNDPDLPRERTEALFDAWVERCVKGLAWRIYALEDNAGVGRGFVIYLRGRGFENAVGVKPIVLDYLILDPDARGGGKGPAFVAETLRRECAEGFDYCELRTSQHNHPAVGCYEKLGFRLCATDFILHAKLV